MSAAGDYLTDEWGNPIVEGEPVPVTPPGSTAPTVFSLDYYRNKVAEFQNVLLEMDAAASIARQMIEDDVSPEITAGYQADIQAFEAKKGAFRLAAVRGQSGGRKLPTRARAWTTGRAARGSDCRCGCCGGSGRWPDPVGA